MIGTKRTFCFRLPVQLMSDMLDLSISTLLFVNGSVKAECKKFEWMMVVVPMPTINILVIQGSTNLHLQQEHEVRFVGIWPEGGSLKMTNFFRHNLQLLKVGFGFTYVQKLAVIIAISRTFFRNRDSESRWCFRAVCPSLDSKR